MTLSRNPPHEIGRLVEQVRRLDRKTADALGQVSQLTPYAVDLRYPPRNPLAARRVDRSSVLAALAVARAACEVLHAAVAARVSLTPPPETDDPGRTTR